MRIERVENGYMAYVGNLSCHFSTLHEAHSYDVVETEDGYDIVLHFVKGNEEEE